MKKSKTKKSAKPKKKVAKAKKRAPLGKEYYAQSKRLAVRLLESGDEAMYCGLYTDAKTLEGMFPPLSPEAAKHSFARAIAKTHQQPWTQRISVVVERASKKPIGIASIKMIDTQNRIAEVGMLLARSARAKHYASESSQVLITSIFRRHTVATICTQIPDGHKLAESWVSDLGYARAQDIAPEAVRAPFVRWALSRDTWADTYK